MFGKTTGKMTLEEKTAVSHRAGLPRSSARARSATAGRVKECDRALSSRFTRPSHSSTSLTPSTEELSRHPHSPTLNGRAARLDSCDGIVAALA